MINQRHLIINLNSKDLNGLLFIFSVFRPELPKLQILFQIYNKDIYTLTL